MSKTRESGMPEEEIWRRFFDPDSILKALGVSSKHAHAAEFGCGYGTFTIPIAHLIDGTVYAFDIDKEMVNTTRAKAHQHGLNTIHVEQRDFVAEGTGLADETIDYAMIFNILHAEEREKMLREAWRILKAQGKLAVIHWNYDPATPRGPSMEIRPKPEQCRHWAEKIGFQSQSEEPIDLPPYHYGWIFFKPSQ